MSSAQYNSIFYLLILINYTTCSLKKNHNSSFASLINATSNKEILSAEIVLTDECQGLYSLKQINNDTYINFYDCEYDKNFNIGIKPSCLNLNNGKYLHLTTLDKRLIIIKANKICIGKKDDDVNLFVSIQFKKTRLMSKYRKLKERDRVMLNYQFFN